MDVIAHYLVERWQILAQAWDVFLLAILVVGMGCYAVINAMFATRLANKDAVIEGLNARLAHKEEALKESQDQLSRTRNQQLSASREKPETQPKKVIAEPSPNAAIRRDVSVSEALAYAEFHEWGLRFIDAAGMHGNKVNDHLERFVQLAADGDLTIWGKRESSAVWQAIPAKHWLAYRIEWFDLLRSDAHSESRRFGQFDGYEQLMTSKAQVERHFAPPPSPTMRVIKGVAPPIALLKARILEAQDRIREDEPSEPEIAAIRQTMSSLQLSDDPVWEDDAMSAARSELLNLWERLAKNADASAKYVRDARHGEASYFPDYAKREDLLAGLENAVSRLDAGIEGNPG